MNKYVCPNCGNTDRATIDGNGEPEDSPDLVLLCTAMVEPEEAADTETVAEYFIDACGCVPCAMQWKPNEEGDE